MICLLRFINLTYCPPGTSYYSSSLLYDVLMIFLLRFINLRNFVELARLIKGGGGVHPDYFVKLDFEITVDQQTRARDRTFEGVPDSG